MRLDRAKFTAWLAAKRPDEVVGKSRDCHCCPIALFYFEASGGCEVVIFDDGEGYMIDRGYSKKPLPSWGKDFVFNIDGTLGQITAARALKILAAYR